MNKKFIVFLSSRKSWTLPYIIFSAIFVVIPLLLIVVYAFTDDNGHLTLANFQKFFEHPEAINTFVYSIGIAIITTLICILLGYPAAWILSNSKLNRSKTMVVLYKRQNKLFHFQKTFCSRFTFINTKQNVHFTTKNGAVSKLRHIPFFF